VRVEFAPLTDQHKHGSNTAHIAQGIHNQLMRILITGMSGFAGSHLADLLLKETHWNLIGVSRNATGDRNSSRVQWWQLDLADADGVNRLIKTERPDVIVHLAAQSAVPASWKDPWATYQDNILSQLNLFRGVLETKITPRMLIVSSNEVYGRPNSVEELPYREDHPLRPNNPYAVSKAAQDLMALQYHISHGLDVIVARPFNHVGPSQNIKFVMADFAHQIAQIELGLREPVMRLGNMAAQRDFTDVRDVARAYLALIKGGDGGQVYNVCSSTPRSIQSVLDMMLSLSTAHIAQDTDPAKFRPVDTPISFGDYAKLKRATGWEPHVAFEQTVSDLLNHWRNVVKANKQL
jgi:GDP-4-dehydro-6-deoxy-D-mannose reductase